MDEWKLGNKALALGVFLVLAGCVQVPQAEAPNLEGSRWELVSIASMDDAQGTTRIANPADYTLTLASDGRAQWKLDCNRAVSTWQATAAPSGVTSGQMNFGPVAGTRALCAPPHLDERVVRAMSYVRSYLLRDGKLYLSLMADGGIYEWRPAQQAPSAPYEVGADLKDGTNNRLPKNFAIEK